MAEAEAEKLLAVRVKDETGAEKWHIIKRRAADGFRIDYLDDGPLTQARLDLESVDHIVALALRVKPSSPLSSKEVVGNPIVIDLASGEVSISGPQVGVTQENASAEAASEAGDAPSAGQGMGEVPSADRGDDSAADGSLVANLREGREELGALRDEVAETQRSLRQILGEVSRMQVELEQVHVDMSRGFDNARSAISGIGSERVAQRRPAGEGHSETLEEIRNAVVSLTRTPPMHDEIDGLARSLERLGVSAEERYQGVARLVAEVVRESADDVVASTTSVFREVLPNLNRRYSDGQAVLVRLDRKLRSVLNEFEVDSELRVAIEGQLDDHLAESRIRRMKADDGDRYEDAELGTRI